ncbi:unnamed protein product [Prunus armeniaca]
MIDLPQLTPRRRSKRGQRGGCIDRISLPNPIPTIELKETRKKDKKALFFLFHAVDEAIFERISSCTTADQ